MVHARPRIYPLSTASLYEHGGTYVPSARVRSVGWALQSVGCCGRPPFVSEVSRDESMSPRLGLRDMLLVSQPPTSLPSFVDKVVVGRCSCHGMAYIISLEVLLFSPLSISYYLLRRHGTSFCSDHQLISIHTPTFGHTEQL